MHLIPKYFLASMVVTLFVLYITYPEPRIVIRNPSPHDEVSNKYVDTNGIEYRYHREEVIMNK